MSAAEKLTTIAENQQKVYDAGVQAEYDRFWDAYQQSGERRDYTNAFSGLGWNSETFKPKYDIVVTVSNNCFQSFAGEIDLEERLTEQGVVLDLSECRYLPTFFYQSKFTKLPLLNAPNCNNITNICGGCTNLTNFNLIAGTVTSISSAFSNCTSLTDVALNCVIAASISFQWSPLSKVSIGSVMAALSDEVTEKTVTFQKSAVDSAFETAEGAADGSTSEEWLALVDTKSNWTVTLA